MQSPTLPSPSRLLLDDEEANKKHVSTKKRSRDNSNSSSKQANKKSNSSSTIRIGNVEHNNNNNNNNKHSNNNKDKGSDDNDDINNNTNINAAALQVQEQQQQPQQQQPQRQDMLSFQQQLPVYTYKEQILQSIFGLNNSNSNSAINANTTSNTNLNHPNININRENLSNKERKKLKKKLKKQEKQQQKYKNIPINVPTSNNNTISNGTTSTGSITIITAETGSGKSTQIPQYCLSYYNNRNNATSSTTNTNRNTIRIAVTQPRRVAAMTLAKRVAYEYNTVQTTTTSTNNNNNTNNTIGYKVRFDDNTTTKTQIIYITDGMLLREAIIDPLLLYYTIIFIDEAHERSIATDILLCILKYAYTQRILQQNKFPVLRIVIMSATLHAKTFQNYFLSSSNSTTTTVAKNNTNNTSNGAIVKSIQDKHNIKQKQLQQEVPEVEVKEDNTNNNNVTIINVPGRTYPVQVLYTKENQQDYIEAALVTILQIISANNNDNNTTTTNNNNDKGDILVFLPGQEEIESLATLLKQQLLDDETMHDMDRNYYLQSNNNNKNNNNDSVVAFQGNDNNNNNSANTNSILINGILICVLYSASSLEQQMIAFDENKPYGCTHKVILSTNIAETSVTIPNVRYVIDTGKQKIRYVHTTTITGTSNNTKTTSNTTSATSTTGMEYLVVCNISQSQALQRTGRAGRTGPGYCFRLYTELSYDTELDIESIPEIARVSLCQIILQIKNIAHSIKHKNNRSNTVTATTTNTTTIFDDIMTFDFITPPDTQTIIHSCKVLYALGALDNALQITQHGINISKLPLEPIYGHLLLSSMKYNCIHDILTAVSICSCDYTLFVLPNNNNSISNDISADSESNTNSLLSSKATVAHRRFASYEGDLPTYVNVYTAWQTEALYTPPGKKYNSSNSNKMKNQNSIINNNNKIQRLMKHNEWCQRNYISGRALARSYAIREQLCTICYRSTKLGGLGIDIPSSSIQTSISHSDENKISFLKCTAAGLFLQAASRITTKSAVDLSSSSSSRKGSTSDKKSGWVLGNRATDTTGNSSTTNSTSIGKYRTKVGNDIVSIHPSSTLFGRNPAPKCVVYTELVTTKKAYIRTVTQIREEWLYEVASQFYTKS